MASGRFYMTCMVLGSSDQCASSSAPTGCSTGVAALPGMAVYTCSTGTQCSWSLAWWCSMELVSNMFTVWGLIEPRPEQGSTNSLQGSYFGVLILGLSWQGELGCSNGTSYHYWEEVESVGTASQIFRDRVSETFCKRPDHNFFRLCNGMIVICVAIT